MKLIENEGLHFPQGTVQTKIIRSMLNGKMSDILSGAGGAHCQLCTDNLDEIKDLEIVRGEFLMNKNISDAIDLFNYVDKDECLALPSIERIGITYEPVLTKTSCRRSLFTVILVYLDGLCSWYSTYN